MFEFTQPLAVFICTAEYKGFNPIRRSRFVTLNKHHAYFLLVDNGTVGKYGAEIALKRKLEKFISTQRLSANFSTPLVWDAVVQMFNKSRN